MSKKNQSDKYGFVYSTDPNFKFESEPQDADTLPPAQQKLRVWLETKGRGGKPTTIIKGFMGKDADLETLGKALKNTCGTGGSVKDGEIIIQGDQREKILQWLTKNGYAQSKRSGS